ncbi:MAG: iron-sulfur cluster repair di-iron protein [Myxococcales bacterium]|nr:iron-sulfur cluster repair di-iron protein [Myxococcales bacterium]
MLFDEHTSVGAVVTERPSTSRLFSRLGIDFCCGGKKSLATACAEKGLDVGSVLAELGATTPEARNDWADAPLGSVCDHIERTHHAFTVAELDRLAGLLEKVARVHGAKHPNMVELASVFAPFAEELRQHMMKEERILFPAIRALASGEPARGIGGPVSVMMREHDGAGAALRSMREIALDYVPPEGACNTFKAALGGLVDLETDLLLHVHLENNVLFPRALALTE